MSMKQTEFVQGDPVRVTSGAYAGEEGVIDDLAPECSAVRIHTKSGQVYAFLDGLTRVVKPVPVGKQVIRKR
jgi:hypothetical protein